jgi:hypothetical protein
MQLNLTKLIMTWDIIPGQEQAYIEFNTHEFVPRLMKLGLQPMDSWYTVYGDAPQIMAGWVHEDADVIRKAVESEAWGELREELRGFVANFRYKITPVTGMFQM